jgi:hypothetical protein
MQVKISWCKMAIYIARIAKKYPYWRPLLPADLEIPVIINTYIAGTLGTDCKHFSCKGPGTESTEVYFPM